VPVGAFDVARIKGQEETYRIRVGAYRVIYDVSFSTQTVTVLVISKRNKAYRRY